jgi:hypothetical protein
VLQSTSVVHVTDCNSGRRKLKAQPTNHDYHTPSATNEGLAHNRTLQSQPLAIPNLAASSSHLTHLTAVRDAVMPPRRWPVASGYKMDVLEAPRGPWRSNLYDPLLPWWRRAGSLGRVDECRCGLSCAMVQTAMETTWWWSDSGLSSFPVTAGELPIHVGARRLSDFGGDEFAWSSGCSISCCRSNILHVTRLMQARANQTRSPDHSFLVPCDVRSVKKECVLIVKVRLSFGCGDAEPHEVQLTD